MLDLVMTEYRDWPLPEGIRDFVLIVLMVMVAGGLVGLIFGGMVGAIAAASRPIRLEPMLPS